MDNITNLLNLQGVKTNFLKSDEKYFYLEATTEPSEQTCPYCGNKTKFIHGYRTQKIKDLPFNHKNIIILLHKRRYICKNCGKTFFEKYNFLSRYARSTKNFFRYILECFTSNRNITSIAKEADCSPATVARILQPISPAKPKELPSRLGIDEFKGNTNGEKYQLILTDLTNNKIFDILPCRKKTFIAEYLRTFKNRDKVELFVMDMTGNYKDLAYLLPNAKIVVDRFHYTRQIYWALDNVRKRIQKQFVKDKRIYFKHSRKLLFKKHKELNNDQRQQLYNMLAQSEELRQAWLLKEHFIDFNESTTTEQAEKELNYWIMEAEDFAIPEFKQVLTAFHNWDRYIINSITYQITNAVTEGYNNKIKVLKRNAYGFRSFSNLRKRILFMR